MGSPGHSRPARSPPTVAFMGLGEPLLHPRFLDMVRHAKERGLRAEVTTNALLLSPELAAGLLSAGLDQLVVSIDGATAETFSRVRPGASLKRVVENVRKLHDLRGPYYGPSLRIGLEFVAMRSNVAELPGLNRLAAQLGASFVIVSTCWPTRPSSWRRHSTTVRRRRLTGQPPSLHPLGSCRGSTGTSRWAPHSVWRCEAPARSASPVMIWAQPTTSAHS